MDPHITTQISATRQKDIWATQISHEANAAAQKFPAWRELAGLLLEEVNFLAQCSPHSHQALVASNHTK